MDSTVAFRDDIKGNNDKIKSSLSCFCLFICLLAFLILFPYFQRPVNQYKCSDSCSLNIVESIPDGVQFNDTVFTSVFDGWDRLLSLAKFNISIASSYWTLRDNDVIKDNSSWEGQKIYNQLLEKTRDKNFKLRIVQNFEKYTPDTELLAKKGALVKKLNFRKFSKNGILHTKMWLVDNSHFYVGSANLDWRSLTQVKELGIIGTDCNCLTNDLAKIFEAYWYVADDTNQTNYKWLPRNLPPDVWPDSYNALYNESNPRIFNDTQSSYTYQVFASSSPPILNGPLRTNDVDAILHVIANAKKFVYISVMEYMPGTLYTPRFTFWPIIDDAIRDAALSRNISVKMLISWWPHTNPRMFPFLQSLTDLTANKLADIQIKIIVIPAYNESQKNIPYARVNHAKYMVTDEEAYIGTSNWSADYFLWTGGVSLVIKPFVVSNDDATNVSKNVRIDLQSIFLRDWQSDLSIALQNFTIPHNLLYI